MSNYRILIIDDNEELRLVLGDRLRSEGFEILEAEDGTSGLEAVRKQKPDVILLDLMMPDMRGEQVWKAIQNDSELKEIPILIVTALRQSQDRYWGKSMPHEDFFSKPYDAEALIRRIRQKILQRKIKKSKSA